MDNLLNSKPYITLKRWLTETKCTREAKVDGAGSVSNEKKKRNEENACPLDTQQLGAVTWSFLHTMAAYYPDNPTDSDKCEMVEFFRILAKNYPCPICGKDFQNDLKETPPDTESGERLSLWLCKLHNRVNVKLGKPEFDCSLVFQRWRDGWEDGSCE